jgi:hypothetical protein
LVLEKQVLPPPATFDAGVMLTATLMHFTLSVAYAALLAMPSMVDSGSILMTRMSKVSRYGKRPRFVAVNGGNRNTVRARHGKMLNRAPVHDLFAQHLSCPSRLEGADIVEQSSDIRAVYELAARTADHRVAGTQI